MILSFAEDFLQHGLCSSTSFKRRSFSLTFIHFSNTFLAFREQSPAKNKTMREGGSGARRAAATRKGSNGALMRSLQILCFLTERPLGYPHWPTFSFPKVPGRAFFHNLTTFVTFAAASLVLTSFVRNRGSISICLSLSIYIYIYIFMSLSL